MLKLLLALGTLIAGSLVLVPEANSRSYTGDPSAAPVAERGRTAFEMIWSWTDWHERPARRNGQVLRSWIRHHWGQDGRFCIVLDLENHHLKFILYEGVLPFQMENSYQLSVIWKVEDVQKTDLSPELILTRTRIDGQEDAWKRFRESCGIPDELQPYFEK